MNNEYEQEKQSNVDSMADVAEGAIRLQMESKRIHEIDAHEKGGCGEKHHRFLYRE